MYESFVNIHMSCKRAHSEQYNIYKNSILEQYNIYKHSILLHKLWTTKFPEMDWIELNVNQTLTSRQTNFKTIKTNRFLVGNNLLNSRSSILNSKMPIIDFNMSLDSFKVKYQKELLSNE